MSLLSRGLYSHGSPERQRRARTTALVRWLGITAVVTVMAGCTSAENIRDDSGRVASAGEWSVFDLRPGDCFGPSSGPGTVETVPLVPCAEPHTAEVFAVIRHPETEFPGVPEIAAYADNACLTALESEFGLSVSDGVGVSYILPTAEGWESNGDRNVVCIVLPGDASTKVGSLVEGTDLR